MSKERTEQNLLKEQKETRLNGRILYLTKDLTLVRAQINGLDLSNISPNDLIDNISTDEISPSRSCALETDIDRLGKYALSGLRGGVILPDDIKNGNFEAIVAGKSFGCGSSREHSPLALKGAGIKFIIAAPIERIFLQNSQNQGLLTIQENEGLFQKLAGGQSIDLKEFTQTSDDITKDIIQFGGLLPYLKARLEGKVSLPDIKTESRPMTMAEKIISRHFVRNDGLQGVRAVKPGDSGFVKADFRYGYELSTPLGKSTLTDTFGDDFQVKGQNSIALFQDHLALFEATQNADRVMEIIEEQRRFATKHGINIYDSRFGICHNIMVEKHVFPGQLVFGTDSHTCSLGSLGALAVGIGATEMAGSWLTEDCQVKVPETCRFNFQGKLPENVTAKDVMLYILSQPNVKEGKAVGKVFEFAGEGLETLPFDELFVLTNMSVEGGAFTGIIEPNEVILNELEKLHDISRKDLEAKIVKSDENAQFASLIDIDLTKIKQMVALPGDPRNGIPLEEAEKIKPNAVYIGSCTGGKLEDLIFAANVLKGKKVQIPTYIQASSLLIRFRAEKLGIIKTLRDAGAITLESGCGDCCNLGIGIAQKGEIIVSDTNRNFPGRMGPADVYLVNPAVAAATAVAGRLASPESL